MLSHEIVSYSQKIRANDICPASMVHAKVYSHWFSMSSQYHSRDLTVKWRKSALKRAQSPCNSTEKHKNPRPQMPPTVENHAFISRRCTLSVDRIWPYADTRPTHSLFIRLTRLVSANHHELPRTKRTTMVMPVMAPSMRSSNFSLALGHSHRARALASRLVIGWSRCCVTL